MKTIEELRNACALILEFLGSKKDVADAQVFVSANQHIIARLNYTSHIPSNGVEEPKAVQDFGVGITVVFQDGSSGFGSAGSSLTIDGAKEALSKARISAVKDPEFYGLPKPNFGKRALRDYHDRELMEISDEEFVCFAWKILRAAFTEFEKNPKILALSKKEALPALKLIVGGDAQIVRERMAIASFAMPEVECDESSMAVTSITAMIEEKQAKGSGFFAGRTLSDLRNGGPEAARRAVRSAIETISGKRIESGSYTVIFGPEAVAELMNNLVIGGLTAGLIFAEFSPFQEKFLKPIAAECLTIYDDGASPEFMGAKGITCEGLPTGRTDLIRDGRLVGLLTSHYDYQRLLNDKDGARKLGVDPKEYAQSFWPRNGFRFSSGAGRHFDSEPSTAGSNIIITSNKKVPLKRILKGVRNGVYIGRMWYVYPINGIKAGDFTGTVTADSYLIKDGELSEALRPNTVRVNDNITTLLKKIVCVSSRLEAVNLWGADEAMYAPDLLVEDVRLDSIAKTNSEP